MADGDIHKHVTIDRDFEMRETRHSVEFSIDDKPTLITSGYVHLGTIGNPNLYVQPEPIKPNTDRDLGLDTPR